LSQALSASASHAFCASSRAAFAKKADWFRLLACVGEKKERAALIASEGDKRQESLLNPFWFLGPEGRGDKYWQALFPG
jgi:hypothetical protein